jgi:hypothetical protein
MSHPVNGKMFSENLEILKQILLKGSGDTYIEGIYYFFTNESKITPEW